MKHQKVFTIEEARQTLEENRHLIEELASLGNYLFMIGYNLYKLEYFGGLGEPGESARLRETERIIEILEELSAQGILVKSIEDGIVDFPARRSNGEIVYLCYKLGEEDINFWHHPEPGYQGRKSINEF